MAEAVSEGEGADASVEGVEPSGEGLLAPGVLVGTVALGDAGAHDKTSRATATMDARGAH